MLRGAFPKALWRFLRQIHCLGGEPSWIDFAFMKVGRHGIASGSVVNTIHHLNVAGFREQDFVSSSDELDLV